MDDRIITAMEEVLIPLSPAGEIETLGRWERVGPELLTALESMIVNYAQFGRVTDDFVLQCAKLTMKARGEASQSSNDENGQCRYCGRDNEGFENEPCSDDCPQYEQARGSDQ